MVNSILKQALTLIGQLFQNDSNELSTLLVSQGLISMTSQQINTDNEANKVLLCWIYSNIVGESPDNIDAFFQQGPLQAVAELAVKDTSAKVREECVYVFANICNIGSEN